MPFSPTSDTPPIILQPPNPDDSVTQGDPSQSTILDVDALMADPTLRAIGDLVTAEFRVATIHATGVLDAGTRLSSDPLAAVLRTHLLNLPADAQASARTRAAQFIEPDSPARGALGPLSHLDLRAPLAAQIVSVRDATGAELRLDDLDTFNRLHAQLHLTLAPLAPTVVPEETAGPVSVRSSTVIHPPFGLPLTHDMQAGVFLDRLHCYDKTGVGVDHDRIGLLATGIDPERLDLNNVQQSIHDATFGLSYDMGYFSKGDDWPRPFPQPGGQYLHYTEHKPQPWPRTYTTTITLVQHNPWTSTSLYDDLLAIDNALRGKLTDYLTGMTIAELTALGAKIGVSIGELGGPIGAIIGAVVGALVSYVIGQLIGWIEDYFQDWFFNPFTVRLGEGHLDDRKMDWPQHHGDVYTHTGHYSIDLHHYRRPFDNTGNAIW